MVTKTHQKKEDSGEADDGLHQDDPDDPGRAAHEHESHDPRHTDAPGADAIAAGRPRVLAPRGATGVRTALKPPQSANPLYRAS